MLYNDVGSTATSSTAPRSATARSRTTTTSAAEGTLGVEATFTGSGASGRPSRIGYTWVDEGGDKSGQPDARRRPGFGGAIALPGSDKNFVSGQIALEGEWQGFSWRAALSARGTDDDTSGQLVFGLAKAF